MNIEDAIRSRTHRMILEIAKRDGFISKAVVYKLYVTDKAAKGALDFLWDLGLLRPTENSNKWVYTKFEKDDTNQKKLETKSQLKVGK